MNNINITELIEKLNHEKLNIIDIRDNYEYQISRIPTAININKNLLKITPENYLDKNQKYYIYCNSGTSSNTLVNYLNNMGYDTVNIDGGYNNYLLRK